MFAPQPRRPIAIPTQLEAKGPSAEGEAPKPQGPFNPPPEPFQPSNPEPFQPSNPEPFQPSNPEPFTPSPVEPFKPTLPEPFTPSPTEPSAPDPKHAQRTGAFWPEGVPDVPAAPRRTPLPQHGVQPLAFAHSEVGWRLPAQERLPLASARPDQAA